MKQKVRGKYSKTKDKLNKFIKSSLNEDDKKVIDKDEVDSKPSK